MSDNTTIDWPGVYTRITDKVAASGKDPLEIAKAIDVVPSNLRSYLSGKRETASLEMITRLADYWSVSVDHILTGAEAPAPGAATTHDFTSGGIIEIPVDLVHPWDGNPRKHFDDEALGDLAMSILEKHKEHGGSGILQNLVLRKHPDIEGAFQIAAGESRFRAVQWLIEESKRNKDVGYPADIPLPARVMDPCSDYQMLKIAMTENVQRKNMNPMDEARGYKRMMELAEAEGAKDITTETIADDIGVTRRTVQLRLELVDKLHPDVQTALEEGHIKLAHARALTMASQDFQANALPSIIDEEYGWETQADIRNQIMDDMIDWETAFFDPAKYDGPVAKDPDSGRTFFADRALFTKLQNEAIRIKAAELEEKWSAVEIYDNRQNSYIEWASFNQTEDLESGIAMISIGRDFTVHVYEGLARKETQTAKAAQDLAQQNADTTTGKPPSITQTHMMHARRRKTQALQKGLMGNLDMVKRLLILALLGGNEAILIKRESAQADDKTMHPDLESALRKRIKKFGKCNKGVGLTGSRGLHQVSAYGDFDIPAWGVIEKLDCADIDAFLCELVASAVGSFTYYQAEPGDKPMPAQLADNLSIVGNEDEWDLSLQTEDLDGLNVEALKLVAQGVGVDPTGTGKAIKARILDRCGLGEQSDIEPITDYVLPSLRFGFPETVGPAISNPELYRHPAAQAEAKPEAA